MTESMLIDAAVKFGAAGLMGLLLYVVVVKVGAAIVASQDRVAAAVTAQTASWAAQTAAITVLTAVIARVEAKLDHQLAMDRDRDRDRIPTPIEVPQHKPPPTGYSLPGAGGKEG